MKQCNICSMSKSKLKKSSKIKLVNYYENTKKLIHYKPNLLKNIQ